MTDDNLRCQHSTRDFLKRGHVAAFAKYVIVGGAQNALFYGLTLGLLWLKFKAWQATVILYPFAVTISFLANRAWSFGSRKKTPRQFRKYILVCVAVYPPSIFFTWFQEHLNVSSWLASLITMAAGASVTFLALNHWVFRKSAANENSA